MTEGSDCTLEAAADRVAASQCPLLIGHVRADTDCVGSLAGLALAIRDAGRQSTVGVQQVLVPPKLMALFEWAGVTPVEKPDPAESDLVVVLDTAVASRMNIHGGIACLTGWPMLAVDHHVTNERFCQWNHVNVGASSTSELVFDMLTHLDWPITPTIATLLYAGIHGDTNGFSLPNTTPKSLQAASALAAAGAHITEVCQRLYRSRSRNEFDLLRLIYDNTRISEDGRVAWSTASHDEILAAGCNHADIDDQVLIPRSLGGADVAILFSEGLPGSVRINIRCERNIDILPLAREFGGGGHNNSAGTSIKNEPFQDVVQKVVNRAVTYLAERYPRGRD